MAPTRLLRRGKKQLVLRVLLLITACSFLCASSAAKAQGRAPDALRAAGTDPMDLERVARGLGDTAVLARLQGNRAVLVLPAVLASPYLRAPEAALVPLLTLAAGRDPDLAPLAMRAASQIASALTISDLSRREGFVSQLAEARRRAHVIAEDASARADMRAAARAVERSLTALGGLPAAGTN